MTPIVRAATATDADQIARLNADVQALHAAALPTLFKPPTRSTLPVAEVRALLASPDARVLLAEVGGTAVGYAYVEIRRRPESGIRFAEISLYLHHLGVAPDQQGSGVGRALMDAVRALAADAGLTRVELDVWAFNARARRFFAQQGFATYNERMWTSVVAPAI